MIKDMSLLGREIHKVVIIDNLEECFSFQPENGLLIATWTGDSQDKELERIAGILEKLARVASIPDGIKFLRSVDKKF